jgi:hypothetical protein
MAITQPWAMAAVAAVALIAKIKQRLGLVVRALTV